MMPRRKLTWDVFGHSRRGSGALLEISFPTLSRSCTHCCT